ncbi:hypothetical protein [Bradyrhizobium sp. C9]|uniref:hypothetical protein n=1 Tax=Bradyrhizobium sp. C9 TaxID=142585 RepID=UPI0018EA1224|nr:hypothetical protein [Bradyrhizobium sp. C9]
MPVADAAEANDVNTTSEAANALARASIRIVSSHTYIVAMASISRGMSARNGTRHSISVILRSA